MLLPRSSTIMPHSYKDYNLQFLVCIHQSFQGCLTLDIFQHFVPDLLHFKVVTILGSFPKDSLYRRQE